MGLQYFAGERIVLYRLAGSPNERLGPGQLFTKLGRAYEIVIIERGTPGVAVPKKYGASRTPYGELFISFEPGCALEYRIPDVGQASMETTADYGSHRLSYSYCGVDYRRFDATTPDADRTALEEAIGPMEADRPAGTAPPASAPLFVRLPDITNSGRKRVAPGITLEQRATTP